VPISFRTVTRSKNTIRFGQRLNDQAFRDFLPMLEEVSSRGFKDVVLDLRRTNLAYAESILPLICVVEARRLRGVNFTVLLPEASHLRQLFLNTNWAHLLDPAQPQLDIEHPRHLAVRRYETHPEQQDAVNAVTDIVLRNMSLERDAISALEWTVNEITDNVLNHAQSSRGGLVQVVAFRDQHLVKLVVSDGGRGIPAAMREAYPNLKDDEAISEAMKPGVTSPPDAGQGNGLAGSVRIAKYAEGSFKISSGRTQLAVFRDPRTNVYKTQKAHMRGFKYQGTTVMVELSTVAKFDIREALALDGSQPGLLDVIDTRYASEDGGLTISICDESLGVGTRHAGAELRRKCLNLLNAEPGRRLILDWSGVALVSSSFADEAVGKLFVELGPTVFNVRVGHAGAEPLVASLLDRAVVQRVAQQLDAAAQSNSD
jgi:anti-sigma regulatory factor (Ser/Thr protein kinase)